VDTEIRALERALQRAGREVVVLEKSIAIELAQQITHFMGGTHYYVAYCHFCRQTVHKNPEWSGKLIVTHRPDCVGVRLLATISPK